MITICTYSDRHYYAYQRVFVKSLYSLMPDVNCHCVLINYKDSQQKEIRRLHPEATIETEKVKFDNDKVRMIYLMRRRISLVEQMFDKVKGLIFYLDVDSIFHRPFPQLMKYLASCDIALRTKTPKKETDLPYFSGSAIVIRNNGVGKDFIRAYRGCNDRDYRLMANQTCLTYAYMQVKDRARFKPLDRQVYSTWHDADALIWEGTGRKKSRRSYTREMEKVFKPTGPAIVDVVDVMSVQVKKNAFNRMDVFAKMIPIDCYMGKNDYGWDFYNKMQNKRLRRKGTLTPKKRQRFKKLIKSVIANGYELKHPIRLKRNLKIINGAHRLACRLYFGDPTKEKDHKIFVRYDKTKQRIRYGIKWFEQNGFTEQEIGWIKNKAMEVMKKWDIKPSCPI